jgi:hypothetical protein
MGLQFVDASKFRFRKRFDDSSMSLGINAQSKRVANAQVEGCYKKSICWPRKNPLCGFD